MYITIYYIEGSVLLKKLYTMTSKIHVKLRHFSLFHSCFCKQSVKNGEQQICLYNKIKLHGGLKT